MRRIDLTAALLSYLDDIESVEAALSADEEAASLVVPLQDVLAEWGPMFSKERAARRDVTRAQAVVGVRNQQLDRLTKRVGAVVRAYEPALLEKLFCGQAPWRFVRQPLRQQCEKTRDVMVPEIQKLGAAHPLAAYTSLLLTSLNAALAALEARTKAKGARTVVAHDVLAWKEGVNTKRTLIYAELLKIAAMQKYPKQWAEWFFPQPSAVVKEEGLEDEEEAMETTETASEP